MSILALILVVLGLIVSIVVQVIAKTSFWIIIVTIIPYLIAFFVLVELISDTDRIKRLEEILLNKEIIEPEDIDEVDITDKASEDTVK